MSEAACDWQKSQRDERRLAEKFGGDLTHMSSKQLLASIQ